MNDAAKDAAASNPPSDQGESKPSTSEPSASSTAPAAEAAQVQRRPPPPSIAKHCFKPGQSGNPKGRAPGVPNLNALLLQEIEKFKREGKGFLECLLLRSLEEPTLGRKLLDKILMNATPDSPLVTVNSFEDLLQQLRDRKRNGAEPEEGEDDGGEHFRTPLKEGEAPASTEVPA
jgi:hypothetical protein